MGTPTTQTAEMANKLKAADPTIVPGPSSPDSKLFPTISMIESRISGADEPKAIRVRLATVPFQTGLSMISVAPTLPSPAMWIFLVVLNNKETLKRSFLAEVALR